MSVKIMSQVWGDMSLKEGRLLVMLALADWSDDDGESWPSLGQLAQKTRMEDRSVRRILRDLESEGYIQTEKGAGVAVWRGNKTNRYWILSRGDIKTPGLNVRGTLDEKGVSSPFSLLPHTPSSTLTPSSPKNGTVNIAGARGAEASQKKGPKRKPDSRDELVAFVTERLKLTENDALWLWDKWQGCGWTNAGKPIGDWKLTAMAWARMGTIFPSHREALRNGRYSR
jgi:hypothetical protein